MSNVTFEQNIARLEEIVKILEQGNASLEESISLFEEGIKITGECNKTLENAKQKISILTDKNGDN